MNQSQPFLNVYTAALQSQLGILTAYLRAVQRLRQSQVEQISASTDEHAQWHKKASTIDDYGALHTLHGDMLGQWMERCTGYWQSMFREMATLQTDLVQALQDGGTRSSQTLREQFSQLQSDMGESAQNMLKPMMGPGTLFSAGADSAGGVEGREGLQAGARNGSAPVARGAGGDAGKDTLR